MKLGGYVIASALFPGCLDRGDSGRKTQRPRPYVTSELSELEIDIESENFPVEIQGTPKPVSEIEENLAWVDNHTTVYEWSNGKTTRIYYGYPINNEKYDNLVTREKIVEYLDLLKENDLELTHTDKIKIRIEGNYITKEAYEKNTASARDGLTHINEWYVLDDATKDLRKACSFWHEEVHNRGFSGHNETFWEEANKCYELL